jgi:hypothetical protein
MQILSKSLVDCFDVETHDIQTRICDNKEETETKHIQFLGFHDIREEVTLDRVTSPR